MATALRNIDVPIRRPTGRRTRARVVGRDLVIVIILLIACEAALRSWAPEYSRNVYDQETTGAAPMGFNAAGYRGPLPRTEKQPGEFRVLALGDSVTFGTGLAVEETWPAQLAEQIRAGRGSTVSVINGGMAAADVNQLRLAYEQEWSAYSPDVVTLVATGNMVSLAWIRRNDPPSLPHNGYLDDLPPKSTWRSALTAIRRAASGLCISGFTSIQTRTLLFATGVLDHRVKPNAPYGVMLSLGWRQGGLDPQRTEEAWRLFETDLVRLADSVKSRGGRLVVAFAPPRFLVGDSWRENMQYVPRERLSIDAPARFARICRGHGIEAVNLLATLRAPRQESEAFEHRHPAMFVPGDYTHFDREGSSWVARGLQRVIFGVHVIGLDVTRIASPGG